MENVHPASFGGTKSRGMRRTQKVYGIRWAGCKGLIFTTGRYRVTTKNYFILQSLRFEAIHLIPCTASHTP